MFVIFVALLISTLQNYNKGLHGANILVTFFLILTFFKDSNLFAIC